MRRLSMLIAGIAVLIAVVTAGKAMRVQAMGHSDKEARFDNTGKLTRPENYRKWIFVGAPVTPNDMNDGHAAFPEFHVVYMDPKSYREYKKTGSFPDGTILMKELVSVGAKSASSGNGYFMGEYIGLEAAVKDSKRFPDEPGNWAYFSFTTKEGPLKDVSEPFPAASCNACHEANAKEDWVFTQYYPVLRDVKERRAAKPIESTGGARY